MQNNQEEIKIEDQIDTKQIDIKEVPMYIRPMPPKEGYEIVEYKKGLKTGLYHYKKIQDTETIEKNKQKRRDALKVNKILGAKKREQLKLNTDVGKIIKQEVKEDYNELKSKYDNLNSYCKQFDGIFGEFKNYILKTKEQKTESQVQEQKLQPQVQEQKPVQKIQNPIDELRALLRK